MPDSETGAAVNVETHDGEQVVSKPERRGLRGWMQRHPLKTLLLVFVLVPLLTFCGLWAWLRLTTMSRIKAELNAMGLPADGAELNHWRHPKDDGTKEFREALQLLSALESKYGTSEFRRLSEQIKADEFAAHRVEFDRFFQEFKTVKAKISEALQHEDITFGVDYTAGGDSWKDWAFPFMVYRAYTLALVQNACYEAILKKDPTVGLQQLREGLDVNRKLHSYTLTEQLLISPMNGLLSSSISSIMQQPGLQTQPLQELGEILLADQTTRRETDNLQYALAGELAVMQDMIRKLRSEHSPSVDDQGKDTARLLNILAWSALGDLDYETVYRDLQFCYSLSRKEYPEAVSRLESVRKKKPSNYEVFSVRSFLPLTRQMNWKKNIQSAFRTCSAARAQREEAGIACLLAADRLEGKDWPRDLSDARLPQDPFTQKPFKLILTPDSVLICSVGPDGKSSGKEAQYNRTGMMPVINRAFDSLDLYDGQDDIVFRLPRKLYDQAAGKGITTPLDSSPSTGAAPASAAAVKP